MYTHTHTPKKCSACTAVQPKSINICMHALPPTYMCMHLRPTNHKKKILKIPILLMPIPCFPFYSQGPNGVAGGMPEPIAGSFQGLITEPAGAAGSPCWSKELAGALMVHTPWQMRGGEAGYSLTGPGGSGFPRFSNLQRE